MREISFDRTRLPKGETAEKRENASLLRDEEVEISSKKKLNTFSAGEKKNTRFETTRAQGVVIR